MNKKVVLGLALLGLLYWQYGRSNDKEQAVNENNPPDGTDGNQPQPQPSIGNEYFPIEPDPVIYDELEGKIIVYPKNKNIFVVRHGEKWVIASDQALNDYIISNPGVSRVAIEVELNVMTSYPTAGHLESGPKYSRF